MLRHATISKFKATCLSVLENVKKTGTPVQVTRFGKPIADIVPPAPESKGSWLGCMRDSVIYLSDDIVGPIYAFEQKKRPRKRK